MRAWLILVSILGGCGLLGGDEPGFSISGRVATPPAARTNLVAAAAPRTITHVMAVNPETASPQRTIAAVATDGSFELHVDPGKPYVFVFVDDTAVGADMAVAVFRANTLDTISPQLAGHLDLEDVQVDPTTQVASAGITYDDLIASLGLDDASAAYLGAVDDLSLRYANPDIDGNGTVDLVEGHTFALDLHVRANLRHGSTAARNITVADLTDQFLATEGADVATPVYNLTSAYVEYPASFDATEYVAMAPTGPGFALEHGAAFTATLSDGSAPATNSSFSALGFGDMRGWGADYDLEHVPGLELPGSGGVPATLAYTLGATGTTLTFTNVVTRTRASLTDDGTLAIFIRLATATDGTIATIDYRWMKRVAAAWVPATANEIAVTIGSDGGYVSVHHMPSWHDEVGVQIPAQPTGSVAWSAAALRPDEICGLAVSFDDKLGLRHFIGGADPNPGVSCAP
ncbi:MAG: hypothetical protein NT062_32360 [Proteobacteria bacterium]|nr:hypothetical protein [Pseudomonadota bacterium]